MFDAPADAWYVWLGVAIASVAVAGVAIELPSTPPPDATAAANAIDRAAGAPQDASATYDHDAEAVRIDGDRVSMRNDGGTTHATLAFANATPVGGDEALLAVLHGASPLAAFGDADAFEDAVAEANRAARGDPTWRPAGSELTVRSIRWGDVRVTLVDA